MQTGLNPKKPQTGLCETAVASACSLDDASHAHAALALKNADFHPGAPPPPAIAAGHPGADSSPSPPFARPAPWHGQRQADGPAMPPPLPFGPPPAADGMHVIRHVRVHACWC